MALHGFRGVLAHLKYDNTFVKCISTAFQSYLTTYHLCSHYEFAFWSLVHRESIVSCNDYLSSVTNSSEPHIELALTASEILGDKLRQI